MVRGLALALFIVSASAQTVQVYSEFARLSDSADVLAPAEPREILSPAVPRNAFTTFQVAIQAPKDAKYHVFVGQNPDGAAKVTLYRKGNGKLEAVGLPYEATGSQVFWLDLWLDAAAPVRRIKIEPQIFVNGDWLTYPMEVRVSEAVVPDHAAGSGLASPWEMVHTFLCGGAPRPIAGRVPIQAALQFRNALQDIAWLSGSSQVQREAASRAMGGCTAPLTDSPADPEAYLHLRDLLVSLPSQKMR